MNIHSPVYYEGNGLPLFRRYGVVPDLDSPEITRRFGVRMRHGWQAIEGVCNILIKVFSEQGM